MNAIISDTINKPDIVSISWGGPEETATTQFQNEFDQLLQSAASLGITVCVAAGDSGSADFASNDPNWDGKAHVDFPASDPFVLGCGGTQLTASSTAITKEVVWDDGKNDGTGGGVSRVFALPNYQQNAGVPPAADPAGPSCAEYQMSPATQLRVRLSNPLRWNEFPRSFAGISSGRRHKRRRATLGRPDCAHQSRPRQARGLHQSPSLRHAGERHVP